MVLLNPKQGEKKEDYILRFNSDAEMQIMFPDSEARLFAASKNYDDVMAKFSRKDNVVKEAEIFAVGTWNGFKFTREDLESIVEAFSTLSEFHKVPLKLGHNKEQKVTDGQPALGWVDDVWIRGKKLMARFVDVPEIVIKAIEKKLYRSVSVELLQGVKFKGKKFSNVLDAVALLGAEIPAVGNLEDLRNLMQRSNLGAEGVLTFSAIGNKSNEDNIMTPEEIARMQADNAALQASLDSEKNKTKTFAADKLLQEEAAKVAKITLARENVTEMLERAVVDKKITPAQKALFERTLRVDNDEAVVGIVLDDVNSLIGDGKVKDFSRDEAGSEDDNTDNTDNTDTDPGLIISDKAYEYMDTNPGVSFERASIVVMSRDRKIAKKYINSNDVEAA